MFSFKLKRYGPKNNYYVFWSEGGRSKRWSTRTHDHELAKKREKAFVRDFLASLEGGNDEDVYLKTVLDTYMDERGGVAHSPQSLGSSIKSLNDFYGEDFKVVSFKPSTHLAYEKHCRELGHKNSTINQRRTVLLTAMNYARDNRVLKVVPSVPMLPTPPRRERFLSRNEAARMLRAARAAGAHHVLMFIRVGLYTGARTKAILQLTWDRINLERRWVDFRLPGVVVTSKRRPNTHLNFRLVRAFRAYQRKTNSQFVIAYRDEGMKIIRNGFMEIAKKAGVKGVTPHVLKHTAITWLLHNKLTPWQVSGITATSVKTILKTYGHHIQEDLADAVNVVINKSRGAQMMRNGVNGRG